MSLWIRFLRKKVMSRGGEMVVSVVVGPHSRYMEESEVWGARLKVNF